MGEFSNYIGVGAWGSSVVAMFSLIYRFETRYVRKLEQANEACEQRIQELENVIRKKNTYQNKLRIALVHLGHMPPEEEE
jgi:hypothetical protein